MKLSIGLVAVVTAVPDDFEQPEACLDLGEEFVNCWQPHSDLGWCDKNLTDYTQTGECGFQYKGDSMTNATCKGFNSNIDGFTFDWGNAAFVAKGDQYGDVADNGDVVGLDFSGDVNIVGKWNVEFNECPEYKDELANYVAALNDANENNTTKPAPFTWEEPANYCYFPNKELVDSVEQYFTPPTCNYNAGGYYNQYAIMITNQHAGDANNNYAIANYGGKGSSFSVNFPGKSCVDYGFTLHDNNQADLQVLNAETDCTLFITVEKGQAQLLYFQGSLDEGVVDFFDGVTIQSA